MILGHQSRRLVQKSSRHVKSVSSALNPCRNIHLSVVRRATEMDDSDANIIEPDESEDQFLEKPAPAKSHQYVPMILNRHIRHPSQTNEEIDREMGFDDLQLRSIARTRKRELVRWLKQEGQQYHHIPQHLAMDLENRRIEGIRRRAEERMYTRLNAFYNTLTLDEIENKTTSESIDETPGQLENTTSKSNEPAKAIPGASSPFQKILTGELYTDLSPAQVEKQVLTLLQQRKPELHKQYQNYIKWCDYTIRKSSIWFSFPDKAVYRDMINRIYNDKEDFKANNPDLGRDELKGHEWPIPPLSVSHFLKIPIGAFPFGRTPFVLNKTFRAWRPLSHSKRLQMFDAWREGLGLRNVAWLGGVSWRRVDGIIGILKREWEYVQKGGKLEMDMAKTIESLLAQTPIYKGNDIISYDNILSQPYKMVQMSPMRPKRGERDISESGQEPSKPREMVETQKSKERFQAQTIWGDTVVTDLVWDDTPLADPKMVDVPGSEVVSQRKSPFPGNPVIILQQPAAVGDMHLPWYKQYIEAKAKVEKNVHEWESSQKEPLVEIPIKRTKQYFAIIQEMEEYSEKRAAKALDGVDGRTMTEKEDGIKMFERFFGGLRSLGGREKFQGTPPWERNLSPRQWAKLAKQRPVPAKKNKTTALGPADAFRLANATELAEMPAITVEKPKERVIWRFEDVSWVKQKTTRPRKQSYAGQLDRRVQLESGVERYGPFGIGSGIEGVGGVRHVIERGIDGKVRLGRPDREKKKVRREIIV